MVDTTRVTADQWTVAATVLRGAADQSDEYSEVMRKSGAADDMGFASTAVGLRRIAAKLERHAQLAEEAQA